MASIPPSKAPISAFGNVSPKPPVSPQPTFGSIQIHPNKLILIDDERGVDEIMNPENPDQVLFSLPSEVAPAAVKRLTVSPATPDFLNTVMAQLKQGYEQFANPVFRPFVTGVLEKLGGQPKVTSKSIREPYDELEYRPSGKVFRAVELTPQPPEEPLVELLPKSAGEPLVELI